MLPFEQVSLFYLNFSYFIIFSDPIVDPEMDVIVEEETKDSEETSNSTEADTTDAKNEEGTDDNKSQDVQLKEEDGEKEVVDTKSDSDEEESLFPDTTIQLQHIRGEKWVSKLLYYVIKEHWWQ